MRPLAAIDIGSNTVHLLVGLPKKDKPIEHLASQSELLELGREVQRFGRIRGKKLRQVQEVLEEQIRVARKLGAKEILIAATGAFRLAENGLAAAQKLERHLGVDVHVLSAEAEARLAFLGSNLELEPRGSQVLIDGGGASTEVTLTTGRRRRAAVSMEVGASMLCAELKHDPPGPLEWARLSLKLADALATLPKKPAPTRAIAVGGAAHRIEELHGGKRGAPVHLQDLERIARRLLRHRARRIARDTGIEKKKITLLAAGTLILHAVLAHYGMGSVVIGHHGLRDGMIAAHQKRKGNWWR